MEAERIIPEIIDTVPAHVATVKFPSGVEMALGAELTPTQVKDTPTVDWPTDPGTLYTVLFLDLDAPSRAVHTYREIIHWWVANVPGTDIGRGETIFPYVGSGTPEGTGLHRYVLFVFKQSAKFDGSTVPNGQMLDRFRFNTRELVAKNSLVPVAGNYYLCQCDDLVRASRAEALAEAFKSHEIIPDVVDVLPKQCAEVLYPNPGMLIVFQGGELTPTSVKDQPTVAWKAEPKSLYTLLFVDPDAPSRTDQNLGEFLHWQVVNIPGNDLAAGDTIAEFIGSGPPKDTGLHRYVLLIFKQSGSIRLSSPVITNRSTEGRAHFKVRAFAGEYNLGDPVAGSLYLAQFDDYVPLLHAQLGF